MSTSGLAPAGSSTYQSATMYVGDGTWDSSRNTFLLPNLVGLNFNTMRYNGMANRFSSLPQYHTLIRAHAILAAIVFLLLVPFAILAKRFLRSRAGLRYHIWLQSLTVLLITAAFTIAYFAVGRGRSWTNPHHGIGLALFVLVLVQFIGGWWVHSRERRKMAMIIPIKNIMHKWLGRIIALLGLAQVPLGLTLYGSPKALFILYTLWAFFLVLLYFILSAQDERSLDRDEGSDLSYASGSRVGGRRDNRRRSSGLGQVAKGAVIGLGAAALYDRFRRRRSGRHEEVVQDEVVGSRLPSRHPSRHGSRHSVSMIEEEKLSEYDETTPRKRRFDRAIAVGVAGVAGLWGRARGRKRQNQDGSDAGRYRPAAGGPGATELSEEVLEEGRVRPAGPVASGALGPAPVTPVTPAHHRRRSHDSDLSYSSYMSDSPSRRRRNHGLRNAVAGFGAFAVAREMLAKQRRRREERRTEKILEQDREQERIARQNSRKYTGDGFPARRSSGRRNSLTATSVSALSDDRVRRDDGIPPAIPVVAAGGAALAAAQRDRSRHGASRTNLPPPNASQTLVPPPPLNATGALSQSSISDFASPSDERHHRRRRRSTSHAGRDAAAAAGLAGAAAGAALADHHRSHSRRRRSSSRREDRADHVASPPVSVKVQMHSDGRHVTLRRLPEDEAAAERAARRSNSRRRRAAGSVSELSGSEGGRQRWRRTEARERAEAEEMAREDERRRQAHAVPDPIAAAYPPPPPLPAPATAPYPTTTTHPPLAPPHTAQTFAPVSSTTTTNLAQPRPTHLPPPPPMPQSSSSNTNLPASLRPGTAHSVGSPQTWDNATTGTEASADKDYAGNRRRRRAERQANRARGRVGEEGGFE